MTASPMRADVRAFLDYLAKAPGAPLDRRNVVEARRLMIANLALTDLPVGLLATIRDVVADGPDGGVPCRLFDARASRGAGPVLVFFHGGGFALGDLDFYAPLCAELARMLDLPVVSVGYRLAPEHPFPAAPDDCEAAARWVATSPAALGIKASSLVLAGDSAGGNLTIVIAMALRDAPAAVPVIAQAPFYPALGRAHSYPSFATYGDGHFLTADAMRFFADTYAADMSDVRGRPADGRFEGLPPALVVTASLDPLVDEGRAYVGRLAAAGVPVIYREAVGNIHGFLNFRRAIPSSVDDLAGALAALKPLIAEAEAARSMGAADLDVAA